MDLEEHLTGAGCERIQVSRGEVVHKDARTARLCVMLGRTHRANQMTLWRIENGFPQDLPHTMCKLVGGFECGA